VGECFFWYRPTRVVPDRRPLNGCVCVCVCVCMSMVITMSPTKTAEPIGVPFMVWTRVGLRNHVLGEGPYPQMNGHLGGHN